MTREERAILVERLHQTRPYIEESIRLKLKDKLLTTELANEVLSGDERRIKQALKTMWPLDSSTWRGHTPWMTGLSERNRIQVINKLAEATMQSADKLRDHMLKKKVGPTVAQAILYARTREEVAAIAEHYHLLVTTETKHNKIARGNWQKGASEIQRSAIIQRMILAGAKNQDYCYEVLRRNKVPEGFGLYMLQAEADDFLAIMAWLTGKKTKEDLDRSLIAIRRPGEGDNQ
ncbi:hypothetical protein CBS101457_002999 [Exobasidium rhododendri]|nr:hypothetical protein CBS101457_002999 [Exobasidium rhododendri]